MLWQALVPLAFLVIALALAIKLYRGGRGRRPGPGGAAVGGCSGRPGGLLQRPLIADLTKAAVDSVGSAMGAIFILFRWAH